MVSKVAVVALVAILAVPILLGYGMNLTETTGTDYAAKGESVNVTPLLQTDIAYSYAYADPVKLNTFNTTYSDYQHTSLWPIYNRFSSAKSSLYLNHSYSSTPGVPPGSAGLLSNYNYCGTTFYGGSTYPTLNAVYDNNGVSTSLTVYRILSWQYIDSEKTMYYTYDWPSGGAYAKQGSITSDTITVSSYTGSTDGYYIDSWRPKSSPGSDSNWVDISSGFYLKGNPKRWNVTMPENTRSVLFTVNLDSITDANYSVKFAILNQSSGAYTLQKTTSGGVVSWTMSNNDYWNPETRQLYYDPNRTDNTYQFSVELTEVGYDPNVSPSRIYNMTTEYSYVGGWPTTIGKANAYITDTWTSTLSGAYGAYLSLDYITFQDGAFNATTASNYRTPTLRFDDAYFRALEYPAIKDVVYNPSDFKEDPATKIENVNIYGSSLTFGGNVYAVNDGKITLSGRNIPVDGLVFSSVPNGAGGYDNMIGKTIVSSTANPSTITFTGTWSANVSTQSMEQYSYTKTEWTPGEFAWDGIDQNFLMIGMLTAIGVFVALGIAYRTTKAALGALLVVCGGAILLFFTML